MNFKVNTLKLPNNKIILKVFFCGFNNNGQTKPLVNRLSEV